MKYAHFIHRKAGSCKQQGATLIVGLIMLFLLTIIGMASMNVTTVDVKVTSNAKDRQLAFVGAESGLFNAGQTIINFPEEHLDNTTPGYVHKQYELIGSAWWNDKSNWSLAAVAGTLVESQFKIENPTVRWDEFDPTICNTGPSCGKASGYYPTTVKSNGPGQASVILQSYYSKLLDSAPPL